MLICLSASHETCDLDTLGRVVRAAEGSGERLRQNHPFIGGIAVLSTCNRVEWYLDAETSTSAALPLAFEAVVSHLADAGVERGTALDALTHFEGVRVAEHLFRVASGLDSVVRGEDEISGQVRRALEQAHNDGVTSFPIERLFQRATATARQVRTTAKVGEEGRSLVRLALRLAEARLGDWKRLSVLLVGTGEYARTTVAALRELGVERVSVFSPSGRARAFAEPRGLTPVERDDLPEVAHASDLIVTCTRTHEYAVDADLLAGSSRQQLVIDLGVPRNVDAAVADLPNVELLDLETVRLHAPLFEFSAGERAEEIIGAAVREFGLGVREQVVEPAMVALREQFLDTLEDEIARMRRHTASEAEAATAEQAMRHLVAVLLHRPMTNARELAHEGQAQRFVDGIEALYGVRTQDASVTRLVQDTKLRGSALGFTLEG